MDGKHMNVSAFSTLACDGGGSGVVLGVDSTLASGRLEMEAEGIRSITYFHSFVQQKKTLCEHLQVLVQHVLKPLAKARPIGTALV
jgi:hypothetical protein